MATLANPARPARAETAAVRAPGCPRNEVGSEQGAEERVVMLAECGEPGEGTLTDPGGAAVPGLTRGDPARSVPARACGADLRVPPHAVRPGSGR